MRIILAFLALVAAQALAVEEATISELIKQLDADEFDTREEATRRLGSLPAEYCNKLLVESYLKASPEANYRLHVAAKAIFLSKIVVKEEEWLKKHGMLGYMYEPYTEYGLRRMNRRREELAEMDESGANGPQVSWIQVTQPDTDAENKLKQHDIVLSIDGKPPQRCMGVIAPEREYTLVVMRPNKEVTDEHSVLYPEDYTRMEVKVTSTWRDPRNYSRWEKEEIEEYEERSWQCAKEEAKFEAQMKLEPK